MVKGISKHGEGYQHDEVDEHEQGQFTDHFANDVVELSVPERGERGNRLHQIFDLPLGGRINVFQSASALITSDTSPSKTFNIISAI